MAVNQKFKTNLLEKLKYLPEKLRKKLMTFQAEGVYFAIQKCGRCLIADEMGLGKTLQALAIAYYYREEWPLLIIVPSSLKYPWIEEVEKWLPEINPQTINLIQSGSDIGDISKAEITIVTYGLLRHPSSKVLQEALYNQNFQVIIVDESHYMKNRKAVTTKTLVPLLQQAPRKLLLTGTPALNRPEELFPQVDSLYPGQFGSWSQFALKYCNAHYQFFGRQKRWVTDGASNLQDLQFRLRENIMIRRLKKDVLTQLPPKQRQRIAFQLKDSEAKKDLDSTWDELQVLMGRKKLNMVQMLNGSNGQSAQQQPSSDNFIPSFEIHRLLSQLYNKTCLAKIGPVKEYLKMLCDNQGLKILVFAYHHVMMDTISEQLIETKIKFIRIDGKTLQQDRPRLVHQFQDDANTRVAVLSTKAAGVGLTLTAAKLVVFAELDWTPGTLEQCEDRAHRIGQKDTVHVHYLVAKGTLDEWVWSALNRKTTVVTTTLNGKRQVLSMDDGNKGQIDCLSNANAYVPTEKTQQDVSSFFPSPEPRNQKTLLQFFTPKGKDQQNQISETLQKNCGSSTKKRKAELKLKRTIQFPSNKQKPSDCEESIILSSDDDNDDFQTSKSASRKKIKIGKEMEPSDIGEDDIVNSVRESKVDDQKETVRPMRSWSCVTCTYLNHNALPYCEMCSTPKAKRSRKDNEIEKITSPSSEFRQKTDNTSKKRLCDDNHTDVRSTEVSVIDSNSPELSSIGKTHSDPESETLLLCNSQNNKPQNGVNETVTSCAEEKQINPPGKNLLENTTERTAAGKSWSSCTDKNSIFSQRDQSPVKGRCVTAGKFDLLSEDLDNGSFTIDGFSDDDNFCNDSFSDQNEPVSSVKEADDKDLTIDDFSDIDDLDISSMLPDASNLGVKGEDNQESDKEGAKSGCDDASSTTDRVVNLDTVPVYDFFKFCCSKNTNRIYLYDEDGNSLNLNFTPQDVELGNMADLPDLLLHPENLRLVRRFVREWNSLAPTKRRLILKSGCVFSNPCLLYDQLRTETKFSKQRYMSKTDVAAMAISKAESVGGTVRMIQKPLVLSKRSKQKDGTSASKPQDQTKSLEDYSDAELVGEMKGLLQALDKDGNPLCVMCQEPYQTELLSTKTMEDNPWHTRFCTRDCMQQFWIKRHRDYSIKEVYEADHGVCQLCQFNAQEFFENLRIMRNLESRAQFIKESPYKVMKSDIKERMVKQPYKGLFWHVDHIIPVAEGGGECDVDNLRTLCTVCHQRVTSEQNVDRAKRKRMRAAAKCGDITAFFKPM